LAREIHLPTQRFLWQHLLMVLQVLKLQARMLQKRQQIRNALYSFISSMDGIRAYEGMRYWGYSTRERARNQIRKALVGTQVARFTRLL
jgi:hypothetical protein